MPERDRRRRPCTVGWASSFPSRSSTAARSTRPARAARRRARSRTGTAGAHRLPRFFYEVDSWQTARHAAVRALHALEFMTLDVREAAGAAHLPALRPVRGHAAGRAPRALPRSGRDLVHIAANGGYRTPAHGLSRYASPHCWGTAANIYRIGDDLLDSQERIERYAKVVARVCRRSGRGPTARPGIRGRPSAPRPRLRAVGATRPRRGCDWPTRRRAS